MQKKRQKIIARRKDSVPNKSPKAPKSKKPTHSPALAHSPSNTVNVQTKKARMDGMNDLQSIEFASFDTSSGKPVPTYLQSRKKKPSKAILLQQAQERKKELEILKETTDGQKVASAEAWSNMMKKAQGEKVKDDISKLKKKC